MRRVAIDIPKDDFLAILNAESDPKSPMFSNSICVKFYRLLTQPNVEYNGHFGSRFYIDLLPNEDNAYMRRRIFSLIKRHTLQSTKWLEKQSGKKL